MFKRLLLLLLFLTFTACTAEVEDEPHEMDIVDTNIPGIALTESYLDAYEITEEEWWFAEMPYPSECIMRKEGTRLLLLGWEAFETACGGEAYSRHLAESHESHRSFLGCTGYNWSLNLQYIALDDGLTESQKHSTMMHEAIHVLGSCALKNSDSTHSDSYRWDTILSKAKARVECDENTLEQTKGRMEPLCLFGEIP